MRRSLLLVAVLLSGLVGVGCTSETEETRIESDGADEPVPAPAPVPVPAIDEQAPPSGVRPATRASDGNVTSSDDWEKHNT